MALAPGTRLGPYEVTAQIGVGGMGEVYQATDTNLKRQVAIKVLPEAVATDPERLARFQREAEVLAALNHPNIAQIYGLERASGVTALVMELVEGPTLADLIASRHPEGESVSSSLRDGVSKAERGGGAPRGLSLEDALPIAKQIAEALEAAHEQGIIHRDLKPANVKVRDDGTVKVLDFGLAKAVAPAGGSSPNLSQSPTITTPAMTEMGLILGTAAYMAPEQARGRPVDKRADIWAFGVVLYEVLTGRRAFEGEDVSATLADVIRGEPAWERLPGGLPATLGVVLRRCLEKDPAARVRDIGDVRLALDGAFEAPVPSGPVPPAARNRPALTLAVAVAALVAGAFIGRGLLPAGEAAPPEVTRLTMRLEPGQRLTGGAPAVALEDRLGLERPSLTSFVLSPDGRRLVYLATDGETTRLFLREMGQASATPLSGTEGALGLLMSPDGGSVVFSAPSPKRIDLDSGDVRTLTVEGFGPGQSTGFSWAEDGTVVASVGNRIQSISGDGGTYTVLIEDDPEPGVRFAHPSLLPGGQAVLFNVARSTIPSEWDIVVESLATGTRSVLVTGGSDPRYVPTGHILFMRRGSLMAVPFDAGRLETTGDPVVVVDDVLHAEGSANAALRSGYGQYSVSRSGTIAYATGGVVPASLGRLVSFDRTGTVEPVDVTPAQFISPRFSPGGTRLSYSTSIQGRYQLWVYDIGPGVPRRLTADGVNTGAVWSPDGRDLVFRRDPESDDPGLFVVAADGSSQVRRLTTGPDSMGDWSPDGTLVFVRGGDLWTMTVDGNAEPRPFVETDSGESSPAFSPDGRWLAYRSNEGGGLDVYVRPFPGGEPSTRISTTGGTYQPVWSADGRQLFWTVQGGQLWGVDVTPTAGAFSRGRPRLFAEVAGLVNSAGSLDVGPDGRFLGISLIEAEPEPVTSIEIVQNWFEELRRLVPTE